MKTRYLFYAVFLLALFLTACTDGNLYTNVIPKDASIVASVNLQQMAEKGELTGEDGKAFAEILGKSTKGELNEKEMEIFNNVLTNPKESGLDLQKNVYLFATPKIEYSGLLFAVSDVDKFAILSGLLVSQNVCEPFIEENGCHFSNVDNKTLVMYNDNVFLTVFSEKSSTPDKLREVAFSWIANSEENSYVITDEFKVMSKSKADIAIAGSLDCLPEEQAQIFRIAMPKGIDLKDMAGVFAMNFEKGKLQVDIETIFKSDAAKELAKQQQKIYDGNLKGKFLDKFLDNSIMYLGFTCNGKEAYSVLMENEILKSQIDEAGLPFDFQKVIESLDGEIAMALAIGKPIPQIALYAEVDNDDIIDELDDYKKALDLVQMKYGVEDGVLYLSNMVKPESGKSLEDKDWSNDSKGKLTYFTMDFSILADIMKQLSGSSQAQQVGLVAEYLKSMTMYNDDVTHSHIVFNATDADTNVLKQIVDFAKKTSGL